MPASCMASVYAFDRTGHPCPKEGHEQLYYPGIVLCAWHGALYSDWRRWGVVAVPAPWPWMHDVRDQEVPDATA